MSDPHSTLRIAARHDGLVAQSLVAGELIVSRGFRLLARRFTGPFREIAFLPSSYWSADGPRATSPALAARMGIQGVLRLRSGALLLGAGGQLLRTTDGFDFERALVFRGWRRPTWRGLLCDPLGRVFVAQHGRDPGRQQSVELFRSDDDGQHFEAVHRFEPGQAHHIHFVQADTWGGGLWMGTGDAPHEVRLLRSIDGGHRWEEAGGGDLRWRSQGMAVLPDALVWATDLGSDAPGVGDRLMRLDRKSGQIEEVAASPGPASSISALPDGSAVWISGPAPGACREDDLLTLWQLSREGSLRALWRCRRAVGPRRALRASARLVRGQCEQQRLVIALEGCREMALGFFEADLPPP